jgi:predicted transcriptional regulator
MRSTTDAISPDVQPFVAEIVSSYLTKNQIAPADLPVLITTVYESLVSLGSPREPEPPTPAVPIPQSVKRDYVVCLECGWRGLTLGRHLAAIHGFSREEYRSRWKLPHGHALSAPSYSARRAEIAKQIGLGGRMQADRAATSATETRK